MERLELYITVNSPGEIAGWLVPVLREVLIRARGRHKRITIVTLPCQYASGKESFFASRIEGVDRVVSLWRAFGEKPGSQSARVVLLHLGGEPFLSLLLARRLGAEFFIYSSRPRFTFWPRAVEHYFVPDEQAVARFADAFVPAERMTVTGHLVFDSVCLRQNHDEACSYLGLEPGRPLVAFLAGSRPFEYREGLPFLVRVAQEVLEAFPDHGAVFPIAPTVDELLLRQGLEAEGIAFRGSERVLEVDVGGGRWARLERHFGMEVVQCCRLAVAFPGTNNLQIACVHVPLLVVIPLNKAEEIPLDGLLGNIPLWVPGWRSLKRRLIRTWSERRPYLSLPNVFARQPICPELRGVLSPGDVAKKTIEMLRNPAQLDRISRDFWTLTHKRGAAVRVARRLVDGANRV